ncbi:hypothetical protein HUJ05_000888 [Dendroctonus ponderosae]|nr:hypothetical protein HUJ05_000888 [Dendroctonus ponderosae]
MAVLNEFSGTNNISKKTPNGSVFLCTDEDTFSKTMAECKESNSMDLPEEILNIESVIALTRATIEALNAKFADYKHPPAVYLKEYHELTNKLQNFKQKKRTLTDALKYQLSKDKKETHKSGQHNGKTDLHSSSLNLHYSGQMHSISNISEREGHYTTTTPPPPPLPPPHQQHSQSQLSPVTPSHGIPRFLRAFLPNQQRTFVQIREGLTLQEALEKPMNRRNLNFDMCRAYLGEANSNQLVSWQADISSLDNDLITIKIIDKIPIPTSISHNYVRKTFFSIEFCEVCRKLVFSGFHCRTCGYKFHQKCATGVPPICHLTMEQS